MTADVVRDRASAGRMADKDQVVQIELFDQLGEIVGIPIHVVAVPGLIRPSISNPTMNLRTVAERSSGG